MATPGKEKLMADDRREDFGDGGIVNFDAVRGTRGPGRKLATRLGLRNDHVFDYKDVATLQYFISERGKISPRRMTGLSARQQRNLVQAIGRARNIALLPFTVRSPK